MVLINFCFSSHASSCRNDRMKLVVYVYKILYIYKKHFPVTKTAKFLTEESRSLYVVPYYENLRFYTFSFGKSSHIDFIHPTSAAIFGLEDVEQILRFLKNNVGVWMANNSGTSNWYPMACISLRKTRIFPVSIEIKNCM